MDVFRHVVAIHVHFVVLTSRTCQNSSARALLPASCPIFSRSGARRAGTVHLLIGWVLERGFISSSKVVSFVISRSRWDRAATCGVGHSLFVVLRPHASRTGHHQLTACLSPGSLRCRLLCPDLGYVASSVRLCCCQQRGWVIVSAAT